LESINKNKKIIFYLITIIIFIVLKFAYSYANLVDLKFILYPTDKIVSLITNSSSQYISEVGFFHEKYNFIIEKSCSGFNFWALCFIMLSFLSIKHLNSKLNQAIAILFVLFISFFLTIFVNSSRIIVSIVVQNQASYYMSNNPHTVIHEIIGIIINLSFLILIYFLAEYFLNKIKHNEKLT